MHDGYIWKNCLAAELSVMTYRVGINRIEGVY